MQPVLNRRLICIACLVQFMIEMVLEDQGGGTGGEGNKLT
jgi:hypothetical protein